MKRLVPITLLGTLLLLGADKPSNELERGALQFGKPVPKSTDVIAAFEKAKQEKTVKAWQDAADLAARYAGVVDILAEHYVRLSEREKSSEVTYLKVGLPYVKTRDKYVLLERDAYFEIAKIYRAQSNDSEAIAWAAKSLKTSGMNDDYPTVKFIQEIVDYRDEEATNK